jgi:hypothetical protein
MRPQNSGRLRPTYAAGRSALAQATGHRVLVEALRGLEIAVRAGPVCLQFVPARDGFQALALSDTAPGFFQMPGGLSVR